MSLYSGFFNAYKDEETGEFDRTYTEENMTDYLRGTLRQNGVFSNVGNRLNVVAVENQLEVNVLDGKALVNGHWLINDGSENISIPQAHISKYRRDIIVAEWSELDRVVRIRLDEGTAENGRLVELKGGRMIFPDVRPIGFVEPDGSDWGRSFSPKGNQDMFAPEETIAPIGDNAGEDDRMVQIYLAYIDVPPGALSVDTTVNDPNWKPQNGGTARIDTASVKGSWYCPWITSMVLDPEEYKDFDFDAFTSMYKQAIVDWFTEVQESLNINMNIAYYHKTVFGGTNVSKSIRMEGDGMGGYKYDGGDAIQVYYNGLLLNEANNEYTISTDGMTGIITLGISTATIPANNTVDIVVFKGTPLALPTGDNWVY